MYHHSGLRAAFFGLYPRYLL